MTRQLFSALKMSKKLISGSSYGRYGIPAQVMGVMEFFKTHLTFNHSVIVKVVIADKDSGGEFCSGRLYSKRVPVKADFATPYFKPP